MTLSEQKSLSYFTDIKMDGLACALHYDNGVLTRAVTRGDGLVGEDVTMNVRTIENVPLRLRKSQQLASLSSSSKSNESSIPEHIEVRGEIVIFKEDFEKLNEKQIKM